MGKKTATKTKSKTSLVLSAAAASPLSGLNHQVVAAMVLLLCLYTFVMFDAFWRVPALENGPRQVFFQNKHNTNNNNNRQLRAAITEATNSSSLQVDAIELLQHTFPVMVGDDIEVIDHPGILYSNDPPTDLSKQISVPRFWDSSAYGPGGVRTYLGNYGATLPTPQQMSTIGSYYTDPHTGELLETIYISIASYRDPECGPTVESILARAKHPQRIRVAIIDQTDLHSDEDFCGPQEDCQEQPDQAYCRFRATNVDRWQIEPRYSVGPVFARHLAHRMYRGEYYAMQVDSHIRFVQDWDEDIIWQWRSAKNEMAVLTTYLSDIIGSIDPKTHRSKHPGRPIMCKSDYEGNGKLKHLRHGQQPEGEAGIKGQPTLHPFWAAGFSFARGHFVTQVPYDQYLPMVFQGEEISMGLRGFTFGYDYYAAERSVCFHMYAIKENKAKRKKVHLFWENAKEYRGAELNAMKRLNGIIGMANDPYDTTEEEKYGLGKIRTTQKFYDTFGIHTETQTVEQGLCGFVGKPMMRTFHPHLRKNRMGIDYDEIDFRYVDPKKKKE